MRWFDGLSIWATWHTLLLTLLAHILLVGRLFAYTRKGGKIWLWILGYLTTYLHHLVIGYGVNFGSLQRR